jgi:TonB family protein
VKDRKLVASSGERILDREALKLVERSQPFPAFPRLYPHETMTFDVKVPYHIR